jgi:hypothetical protein
MSAVVVPPVAPPAAAPDAAPPAKMPTGVLKFAIGVLNNPLLGAGVTAVLTMLGSAVPAALPLLMKWGAPALGSALSTWTRDTITEKEMETELATKGHKVVPFNPSTLWGGA